MKSGTVRTHVGPSLGLARKLLYSALTVAAIALAIEGFSQLVWWRLENRSLKVIGEYMLRNDAINFMKVADDTYGYRLRSNFAAPGIHINSEGFHQTNEVPVTRVAESLRIICLGESTTFGTGDSSNYPMFLQDILGKDAKGYAHYEVINAGVPGWISDQVALHVQHQLAKFAPDAVILYVGWNDFQSYDPMLPPLPNTIFDSTYKGASWKLYAADASKTVALGSALYDHWRRMRASQDRITRPTTTPDRRYRFLLQNLDDIVRRFQAANPRVKIFVCTLVGLWPQGTLQNWEKMSVPAWVKNHQVSTTDAARLVAELNDQLRFFAHTRDLPLIDMAAVFDPLDRTRLQIDFAHMNPDGYELMAWTMFSALRGSGLIKGEVDPRYQQLLSMYKLTVATDAAASR